MPPGYEIWPWTAELLESHAAAKYLSFCDELDSQVFPCLGDLGGCRRLMNEISHRDGFVPEATWLINHRTEGQPSVPCGTVQGIRDPISGMGAIQNLGVCPEHRGRGLGSVLLLQALRGFESKGVQRGCLEVTAKNEGAVRLYRRFGFRHVKTIYKTVEIAFS